MAFDLFDGDCDYICDNSEYMKEQIITYLGNKRALLPFIALGVRDVQKRLGKTRLRMFDVFSGSGIVARGLGFGGFAPVRIESSMLAFCW